MKEMRGDVKRGKANILKGTIGKKKKRREANSGEVK